MRKSDPLRYLVASASAFALTAVLFVAGCQMGDHPDEQRAVYKALDQNNLSSVTVAQDRHSGAIILGGIVGDSASKSLAENVAAQAAPGYSISDHIQVDSTGLGGMVKSATATAALDSKIENQYKETIAADRGLKRQKINFVAANGTLYLKGSVQTDKERTEAEDLAKKVPEVQHVINDLQVKSARAATNS